MELTALRNLIQVNHSEMTHIVTCLHLVLFIQGLHIGVYISTIV